MILKQVQITEESEPLLAEISEKRKAEKKPYGRKLIVADAIKLLNKTELQR